MVKDNYIETNIRALSNNSSISEIKEILLKMNEEIEICKKDF